MFVKIVKTLNGIMERMTPKQLLLTAAVAGVVMCLLIYLTISSFEERIIAEQPEPVEMKGVVVATVNVPRGETFKKDMLKIVPFATQSIPKGAAEDIRAFEGLPARVDILSGDIITDQKVYSDIRQAGFIGMIPPDCRAVTIPIDNVTGVAGLLKPGDYVDLLLISGDSSGFSNRGTKGEVLLQNVLLISIDQNIDRLSGDMELVERNAENDSGLGEDLSEAQKSAEELKDRADAMHQQAQDTFAGKGFEAAKQGRSMHGLGAAGSGDGGGDTGTATLALKPEDVLKVATSIQAGTIYLALRPFKPAPTSMFIAETEYYSAPPAQQVTRPAPVVVSPPAVSTPQVNRPAVSTPVTNREPTQPRVSNPAPVVNPAPQVSTPPAQVEIPKVEVEPPPSYEVVKWGR